MMQNSLLNTAASLALFLLPATTWAFSEDIVDQEHGFHSTYHYEMTRVLAIASGFSATEAETIAQASSATDAFARQGTDPAAAGETKILGTERGTDTLTSPYFHWPRRGVMNAASEYTYFGGRDECSYFATTEQVCEGTPEVDDLERWAVFGEDSLRLPVPSISVDGSAFQPIQGGSLDALGVYLHGLADSYSHETCMMTGVRSHGGHFGANECGPAYWHWMQEYGRDDQVRGVNFTRESMYAMWQALQYYREHNGYTAPALWNDAQFRKFKLRWTTMNTPHMRKRYANRVFNRLVKRTVENSTVDSTAEIANDINEIVEAGIAEQVSDNAATEMAQDINQ